MNKELIKVSLDQIVPYENNPRKNDDAVEAVKESIRQCEYISPIIVDEDMMILAGHTRAKALEELEVEEVEVLKVEGLSEQEKRKFRLLDNKTGEIAGWDFTMLDIELQDLDFEGYDFGFDVSAIEEELTDIKEVDYHENISVIVECDSDEEAEEIFNDLTNEGYRCRISTL